jgi:hypothetical protein
MLPTPSRQTTPRARPAGFDLRDHCRLAHRVRVSRTSMPQSPEVAALHAGRTGSRYRYASMRAAPGAANSTSARHPIDGRREAHEPAADCGPCRRTVGPPRPGYASRPLRCSCLRVWAGCEAGPDSRSTAAPWQIRRLPPGITGPTRLIQLTALHAAPPAQSHAADLHDAPGGGASLASGDFIPLRSLAQPRRAAPPKSRWLH